MRLTLSQIVLGIFVACLPHQSALGYEYNGSFRTGLVSSKIDFSDEPQGDSNDKQVISTRLDLDVERINRREDMVTIDLRDRYDFFGKADSEILQLTAENTLQIREAAYERPWENNRTFYSLGRIGLPEAGILANDGGEYGYRYSKRTRFAAFLGLAPEGIVTPASIQPEFRGFDGNQGGVYAVYESKEPEKTRSIYMTNALAQAPSFELDEFVNRVYYYHFGTYNLGFTHRVTSFINFDVQPSASLRRGHVSYAYYKKKYRIRTSASRITAEDYRIKKDIRDDLEPSTSTTIKANGRYRYTKLLQFNGDFNTSSRSLDGLRSNEISAGALYTGYMKKRLSLGAKYGIRNDYLSDDTYLLLRASYYQKKWNVFASYTMETESYDDGTTLNPNTLNAELAFFFSDKLRGAASYTNSSAEDRSLTSFMLMIGYQFGSDSTSPTRRRTPIFEDI